MIYFALLVLAVVREKRNKTVLDYFFAGRSLPFWMLSICFIASWWGAGSALSTADLGYQDGLGAFFYYGVPVLISTFLMILGAKAIRKVGYLTQSKMMEARYSKKTAKMLGVMILLFMTFSASSQMVGTGDFFGTYLGLDYAPAVLIGTAIVIIYSMFGGFRAVVMTDLIQFAFLLVSAVAVFAVAFKYCGGFPAISEKAADLGKTGYMNMGSGASKYIAYVITFGCAWMIQANVWQRMSAARSELDSRKMCVMAFFAFIPLYLIVVFTGMAGLVLFDKLPAGGVVTAVVMNYMSPIAAALTFVGISAAIMSTMDSLINTGAMTLTLDLNPSQKPDDEKLGFSRMATLIVSAVALLIALRIRSFLDVSWIAADVITTGVFVPLTAGFLWRRGNSSGAFSSMIAGLAYCVYNLLIFLGADLPAFWDKQSTVQVIIGICISAVVYVVVSLCTPPEYEKADPFIKKAALFRK